MTSVPTPRRRGLGLVVAALAAVVLSLAPAPAYAHATLVSSSPSDGARLETLPGEVVFEFSEEMTGPAYVIVTDPDGASVAQGAPEVDGTTVTQQLSDGPEGSYTMAYKVSSADGHPVSGEVGFGVGAGADSQDRPEAASTPSATAAPAETEDSSDGASEEPVGSGSWWSREWFAVTGAVALFAISGMLLLLARRSTR